MWNRAELKEKGKTAFKINYWKTVLIAFILALTSGGFGGFSSGFNNSDKNAEQITQSLANTSSEEKVAIVAAVLAVAGILFIVFIVLLLLQIFLFNPIQVGCYGFLQKNVEQNGQFDDLNILKDGFANYSHTLVTMLLKDIFLTLWFCLFIIPGFVKWSHSL